MSPARAAVRPWIVLVLATLCATAAAAAPPPEAARERVEGLHDALVSSMEEGAGGLGYEGRYQQLEPVVDRTFDLPFMARKSVGRHWKDLTEEERRRLLDTFRRLTIATYAARFDDHGGERFETAGADEAGQDTVLVRTALVRPDEEAIQLNYRLRPTDDGWQIIDIFLNGTISELAMRRSEYSSVIRREGFDQLLAELEDRIAAYARGEVPEEEVR